MPRQRKGSQRVNPTQTKLSKLPFKTAAELRREQEEIQKNIWRLLEEGRWIREYSQREEYKYRNEILSQGVECKFGREKEQLIHIFADNSGKIHVNINEKNGRDMTCQELLETLSKALTESFGSLYYKAAAVISDRSAQNIADALKTNTKSSSS
jgi:hypothetical protein